MDRLTIDGNFCDIAQCTNYECADHVCDSKKIYERLRELEKLADDGLLVALPCKVGDTVYYLTGRNTVGISKRDFQRVEESKCKGFYIDESGQQVQLSHNWQGNHGSYGVFGKTVFFTREAAEAALEGGVK